MVQPKQAWLVTDCLAVVLRVMHRLAEMSLASELHIA